MLGVTGYFGKIDCVVWPTFAGCDEIAGLYRRREMRNPEIVASEIVHADGDSDHRAIVPPDVRWTLLAVRDTSSLHARVTRVSPFAHGRRLRHA